MNLYYSDSKEGKLRTNAYKEVGSQVLQAKDKATSAILLQIMLSRNSYWSFVLLPYQQGILKSALKQASKACTQPVSANMQHTCHTIMLASIGR